MDIDDRQILVPALEQAVDAVVLIDDTNRINFFNAAAEKLWGYSREEVLGKEVTLLVPSDIKPHHDSYIEANRKGRKNRIVGTSREIRIVRKDGTQVWSSFSLSKIDVGGKIHYMGFLRDMTEERQQREELRLLSLVVNRTHRAILMLDRDRRIIYSNRAFTELFGYSFPEVLGRLPTDFLAGKNTEPDALARIRRGAREKQGFTEDILIYDRHGNTVWVSAAINPILDEQGEVSNVVVVITDITALKRVQSLQDDVLEALASGLSLSEVTEFLCRRVEQIAPDIVSSIVLVDSENKLRPLAGPSLPAAYSEAIDGVPVGETAGSCGTAAWRGKPVYVTDIETDPLWASFKHLALPHGLRACWSSPIKLRDGRIAGSFAFYYREPRGPSPFHEQIVKACLHLSKLAIEREETRRQIALLSNFDALTGLPNRTRLLDEIENLLRKSRDESRKIAFFAVNLDRFKDVNNGLGHAVGDKVLIEAAYRLQRATDDVSAIVSRTGGDSFTIVLPDCDIAKVSVKADKILRAVSEPTEVSGYTLPLSASIGISIFRDNGSDPETLLNHAEMAMYQAKAAGRAAYRFFSPEMNQIAEERLVVGTALRTAVSSNRLKLHYQPQIHLGSKTLHGVEALARWHDPVLGHISPARFIALAEEIGLVESIGRWSLREACRQMAEWRGGGLSIPAVSVNLSPSHFNDSALPKFVTNLLHEFSLPSNCLTVEITESVMMDAGPETLKTLSRLHELGVGLSMDDFGTGFSSLSSLTQMPINELKLDRSFMRNFETDPSAQAVTTAVVRIGQSLGMTVVSEGVETEDQARLLHMLNCTVAQGFYFAKPMAPCDLEQWITAGQPDAAELLLSHV
ncbi:oxygen-sensing cyclic-di-GMP phosphodiesterase DosP [Bradyrhizobium sp. dw_78]|uniref:oxygen-sensing cyclic-di-GMP phosphodiesterase DosP n=1 Tax=Bradyrhizobium sp. dw_78 TaxID=2719793 RepID=UPI001BD5F41A|nr:oxygen-sensing cyclic-di-GMP phosphodiesterase DosP [Bradyrhizobium sp. dw_78]